MLNEPAKKTALPQTTTRNIVNARSLEKEASSSSVSTSTSITETNKKAKTKKKDRRAYYREYNKKHPERLDRGFTKGYLNRNVSDGAINHTDKSTV